MDIQDIQKQVTSLQRCIDNYTTAKFILDTIDKHPNCVKHDERHNDAAQQLNRCEQTIIGQLKLNQIKNIELLK